MSYKPGFCCGCGKQTWVTDPLKNPIMPISNAREGYLVFSHLTQEIPAEKEGEEPQRYYKRSRLKIPVCDGCEANPTLENCHTWFRTLVSSQAVPNPLQYGEAEIIGYEPFKQFWSNFGIEVMGIEDRGVPSHMVQEVFPGGLQNG